MPPRIGRKYKADRRVLASRDRDRKTRSSQGEISAGDRDAADRDRSCPSIRNACGKCFTRAFRDAAEVQASAAHNQDARLLLLNRGFAGTKSLARRQCYKANKNQPGPPHPGKNNRLRRSKPFSHRATQQRDSTNSVGIGVGGVRTQSRVLRIIRVDFGGS